jgi:hypothetical protein
LGVTVNSEKAPTADLEPVLRRCSSCGAVLSERSGARVVRETPATLAMSGAQECAACRLSEYRRALRDQYKSTGTR